MKLRLYQVDAFSAQSFGGNPAAIVPLERWLDDRTLQAIASENNLAETAFLVREASGYRIRWFTPAVEVDLCGHATLAAAHVLFERLEPGLGEVEFASRSGPLRVSHDGTKPAASSLRRPGTTWTSSRVSSRPGWESTRTRSPARRIAPWCRSGPAGSNAGSCTPARYRRAAANCGAS